MDIAQWSAAVAAIAFVVLAWFIIRTLQTARTSMEQANRTLNRIQTQLDEMSELSKRLIQATTLLAEDAHAKMKSLNGFMSSMEQLGTSIGEVSGILRKVSTSLARSVVEVQQTVHSHQQSIDDGLKWAAAGIRLWQHWKAHRQAKAESIKTNQGED
jgi:uncharacterized protein YoxC